MNDRGYPDLSSPTLHLSIILSLTIFVAILSASFFIDIEIIAQGAGKIIPAAKVQVVQPEYSGQVKSIFVKNGARVDKGQLLIELDSTDARAQLRTVKEEIQRLTIERYRIRSLLVEFSDASSADNFSKLNASLSLSDINAENILEINHSGEDFKQPFLRDQHGLMTSEIAEFRSSLASFSAQIDANNKSHSIIEANIEKIDALLLIHEERHQASTTLSRKGIISRASYLNTIEHLTNLQKQRNIHLRELAQNRSIVRRIRAEQLKYRSGLRSKYFLRKSAIESRIAILLQDQITRRRKMANMNLRAPIDGIVDKLNIHTIGAVIMSGDKTMNIVPYHGTPILEVMVANQDVGFVRTGQRVNIKLSAFPSERFGHVKGMVTHISADATEIAANSWGFSIRIEPESAYLKTADVQHKLRPGMTARVDIITGSRTLISYFFAPIIKTLEDSLGER